MAKKASLIDWCRENQIKIGSYLYSDRWDTLYRGTRKVTGFGESCVVMRCMGAQEHLMFDAPDDVRIARSYADRGA